MAFNSPDRNIARKAKKQGRPLTPQFYKCTVHCSFSWRISEKGLGLRMQMLSNFLENILIGEGALGFAKGHNLFPKRTESFDSDVLSNRLVSFKSVYMVTIEPMRYGYRSDLRFRVCASSTPAI